MSQVCDDLEKECQLSNAVQEVNLTYSQTAEDLELCDSVDFQILPDDWDWHLDQPESQPVLQPMTPKTDPNDTPHEARPLITTANPMSGLELTVSSNVVGTGSTSGTSRSLPPVSNEDIKHLVENHENRNTTKNTR